VNNDRLRFQFAFARIVFDGIVPSGGGGGEGKWFSIVGPNAGADVGDATFAACAWPSLSTFHTEIPVAIRTNAASPNQVIRRGQGCHASALLKDVSFF
jgi:hypothetical protein